MGIEINNGAGRTPRDLGETGKSGSSGQARESSAPGSRAASGRGDQLALSDAASQLNALETQISNLPVVDTQRVLDVQHALATGTYEVVPAQVAEKMLSFEAGLSAEQG